VAVPEGKKITHSKYYINNHDTALEGGKKLSCMASQLRTHKIIFGMTVPLYKQP